MELSTVSLKVAMVCLLSSAPVIAVPETIILAPACNKHSDIIKAKCLGFKICYYLSASADCRQSYTAIDFYI